MRPDGEARSDPNPRAVQVVAHWARWVWVTILAVAGAFEAYGVWVRRGTGDTLSEVTRWALRTDTRAGAAVFLTGWTAFALWFPAHVVRVARTPAPQAGRPRVSARRPCCPPA